MSDWTFVPTAEELEGLNQLRDHHHLPRLEKIALASEWSLACAEIDAAAEASDKASVPVRKEQEAERSGHTQGPWAWKESLGDWRLESADGTICDDGSAGGEYGRIIEPDSPNARLIAAAPDLYAACKALEWSFNFLAVPKKHKRQVEALRAAVAKAEGRTA